MSEPTTYNDLREFIERAEELGALRRIDGADPHLEIGAITELAAGMPECPALLFDNITGYPAGFRVFSNATTDVQRAALALNLDPMLRPLEALTAWMGRRATLQPQETVARAAFLDHSDIGGDVDLKKFPVPHLAPEGRRPLHRIRQPRRHARPGCGMDQRLDLSGAGP
ncbi:MAG: UbiD family decarboxylase [Rhodospirillales bacterium]|nr:UbiD family decarboxylase [Rhodospirillales bacterium]